MAGKIGFGIALQNYVAPGESLRSRELVRLAVKAERLGFDSVWVWDHVLLGSRNAFPIQESLTVLGAIAAATERVRLGTGVLVLPIRNPVELAKRVATIDDLSNGRVTLGVAAGWYEPEFRACGVPFKARGRLVETSLEIMRRLWSEAQVNGVYGNHVLKNVRMEPKPIQRPRLPVWMGGYTEKAHERVGRLADGWVSYFYTPESFGRGWHRILDNAKRAGRDTVGFGNCDMIPVRVGTDKEGARRVLEGFVGRYCDLPTWSEATVESGISGTPADCTAALERYAAAGVQNLVLMPSFTSISEIDQQVERLAGEVMRSF